MSEPLLDEDGHSLEFGDRYTPRYPSKKSFPIPTATPRRHDPNRLVYSSPSDARASTMLRHLGMQLHSNHRKHLEKQAAKLKHAKPSQARDANANM